MLEQPSIHLIDSPSEDLRKENGANNPPAPEFKLVHISDPHLSRQFYREHLKSFKLLLRAILDAGCDHLIISGDIVSTAEEDDFYLAREILGKLDLLHTNRLTVVPGNHDIFGGPHRAIDVISFPQYIRNVDYARHLDQFQNIFAETFENVTSYGLTSVFPFIKRIGPFSIIGLNSIPPWSVRRNPLGTNGELDDEQKDGLALAQNEGVLQGSIPLVAIHHHFNDFVDDTSPSSWWKRIESNTMRMRGRARALRLFQALGVRCVLHGHIHRNDIYRKNNIPFMNGAGAVCDDPMKYLKYNEMSFRDGAVHIRTNVLTVPFQVPTYALSRQRLHFPPKVSPLPSTAK
jgi:3',5'-cyclic-AMP phosphodiesterase